MSVLFRGNTNWIQRVVTLWNVDSWGVDHARVIYRGARTQKDAFEAGLTKWQQMPGFSGMRLEGWSSQEFTPSFPGVELHYQGFKSGSVPEVKFIDSTSLQVAQGQGVDTATGKQVSGSFTYRADRTTWIWFETSEPSGIPRYSSVRHASDPLANIVNYHIDSDTGTATNTIPFSAFTAVFNSLRRQLVASGYEREMIIPNLIWACRADIDYKLITS